MPGPPVRDDVIRRYVVAFCPVCYEEDPARPLEKVERLSGYLSERDGRVWLVRGCPTHGRIETMYEEDPEILDYLEEWTAPTKVHTPDTPGNFDQIPAQFRRGLGEMHTQHTCILLEDVTERCNLSCPTCYAGSSPMVSATAPVADVLENLDRKLARERGYLDVLMISGGEPTLHPQIVEILDQAMTRNIGRILLNTNGVRLARDDRLLSFLAAHNERLEVYLQFDGFKEASSLHHRGRDLRAIKHRVLERLSDAEVFTTLVMAAQLDVNDDEIGAVVRYALDTPFVSGVAVQPVFGSGRGTPIDPRDRLTCTGVLRRLGPQTEGLVTWRDLTALPCSHPHCSSVGYMIRLDDGSWRSLVGLLGHEQLKERLGLISNRVIDTGAKRALRDAIRASIVGLLSEHNSMAHPGMRELFIGVMRDSNIGLGTLFRAAAARLGDKRALRAMFGERVKRITVKPFMDVNTMIEERLMQCCVHVGTVGSEGPQAIPFCAAQLWPELGAMKVADHAVSMVPAPRS
ncbi:MAG: radical SAM protein [Actinomycetota bacterium]